MTLVFEEQLRPGYFLEWDDFPYPPSLKKGGKFHGEISMTLAFPPRRNADYRAEYCETHIEASFGIFTDDKEGEEFHGQVPVEHSRAQELYESFQVRNLRKWAPVRTHYRLLPRGVTGNRWRLKVRRLSRHATAQSLVSTHRLPLFLPLPIRAKRRRLTTRWRKFSALASRPITSPCGHPSGYRLNYGWDR
jgi:hypothetical protein